MGVPGPDGPSVWVTAVTGFRRAGLDGFWDLRLAKVLRHVAAAVAAFPRSAKTQTPIPKAVHPGLSESGLKAPFWFRISTSFRLAASLCRVPQIASVVLFVDQNVSRRRCRRTAIADGFRAPQDLRRQREIRNARVPKPSPVPPSPPALSSAMPDSTRISFDRPPFLRNGEESPIVLCDSPGP